MPITYDPITTVTLSSAQSSVTFTGLTGSYTDLVVVVSGNKSGAGTSDISWRANSDTGSNYSQTTIYGVGSGNVESDRGSNATSSRAGRIGASQSASVLNFLNYSSSSTYKNCIAKGSVGDGIIISQIGLWRNLNAITSLNFTLATADNFESGCTFTIYGIAAA